MRDIATALGLRIRELRNERHMSQEELAFKAGISAAHLGQIERALKNPTVDTVDKIAGALGVPITVLFTDEQAKLDAGNPVIGKINAHLMDMTEDQQRDFLRIVRIFHGYLPKDK